MALRDQIYPAHKAKDFDACHRIVDAASPRKDREERRSITYWRSAILEAEGRFTESMSVLEQGRADFCCSSSYANLKARLLVRLGRSPEAIAVLQSAPIVDEHETYPALALEAAYDLCALLIESGQPAPADLLALIPDDFITMNDQKRFVGKSDLLKPRADFALG